MLRGPEESSGGTVTPPYGMKSPKGSVWNGVRWVSPGEWRIATRIKEYAEAYEAYYALPWYKRIFTRRPS